MSKGIDLRSLILSLLSAGWWLIAPVVSLLGLGGATAQVFFESARPYLIAATLLSLAYSFYLVYRRPFRPRPQVIRLWVTAALAAILMAIPLVRG